MATEGLDDCFSFISCMSMDVRLTIGDLLRDSRALMYKV